MTRKILLFLIISTFSFSSFANCDELPIQEIDCATELLIDAGIRDEAIQNGWNVYQWDLPMQVFNMVYVEEISKHVQYQINEAGYFYYIDYFPGALFNHRTEIIYVSAATGKITRQGFNGPPIIDGVTYFAKPIEAQVANYTPKGFPRFSPITTSKSFEFKPPTPPNNTTPRSPVDWNLFTKLTGEHPEDHKERVLGYYEKHQSEQQTKTELRKCKCNQKSQKTHTVVISGFSLSGERSDMDDLVRQLVALGREVRYFRSKPNEFSHDNVIVRETTIVQLSMFFGNMANEVKNCCDEVEIYFGGHGTQSGAIDLNSAGSEEILNGNVSYNPKRFESTGSIIGRAVKTETISKWLDNIKSCRIRVYFYSCYSGSHLQNGINKFTTEKLNEGCHCRTVMTSASHRQKSYKEDIKLFTKAIKEENGEMLNSFFNYKVKVEDTYGQNPNEKNRSPLAQASDCLLCEDIDKDGLLTGVELFKNYSDPKLKDTDKDGLSDGEEKLEWKTDPRKADTDGDKVSDGQEVKAGTDPLDPTEY